jgi:hypothetical protein
VRVRPRRWCDLAICTCRFAQLESTSHASTAQCMRLARVLSQRKRMPIRMAYRMKAFIRTHTKVIRSRLYARMAYTHAYISEYGHTAGIRTDQTRHTTMAYGIRIQYATSMKQRGSVCSNVWAYPQTYGYERRRCFRVFSRRRCVRAHGGHTGRGTSTSRSVE